MHELFCELVSASPRFVQLSTTDRCTANDMQFEVSRQNSVSQIVVARRARIVETVFLDLAALSFKAESLSPVQNGKGPSRCRHRRMC